MLTIVAVLVGVAVGMLATAAWLRWSSSSRLAEAESKRRRLVADGERDAEALRREAQIEAREQAVRLRAQIEDEVRDRRLQLAKVEERINQKESELDSTLVELSRREQGVADRETHARELQDDLKAAKEGAVKELEQVS
jgi:ribonuclease Y